MNIMPYLKKFASKRRYSTYDATTVRNLLIGHAPYSLVEQEGYQTGDIESEYLHVNIRDSVRKYTRDKDEAIRIYKDFLQYLDENGIHTSTPIDFPPVPCSNSFERQMYIAKYLQNPRNKVADLENILWVSPTTIQNDLKKLRGLDDDPIQICGKRFQIPEIERTRGHVNFASTAHPFFLTQNLTQVIILLKGLKSMSDDPLYAAYARHTAIDIWSQLSDYAKNRIRHVFRELLTDDLAWYESLLPESEDCFFTEKQCSVQQNVVLDCIKNGKAFFVEYQTETKSIFYTSCRFIPKSYHNGEIEVTCDQGTVKLYFDKIIRSAYSQEELL